MTHTLRCGDVIPGCEAVLRGDSEQALLHEVSSHAEADHGLTDIDDATLAQVRGAIKVG